MTRSAKRDLGLRLVLLALLAFAPALSRAQAMTAEEQARAYYEALRTGGLVATVEFYDIDEAIRFCKLLRPYTNSDGGQAVRRMMLGDRDDSTDIGDMLPYDIMHNVMPFVDRMPQGPGIRGRAQIIGSVREGEVTHVVARVPISFGEYETTQMTVASFRLDRGEWKLLLSAELENLTQLAADEQLKSH